MTRLQLSEIERFKVSREIEKERVLSLSCEVYFERGRRLRECWDMLSKSFNSVFTIIRKSGGDLVLGNGASTFISDYITQ